LASSTIAVAWFPAAVRSRWIISRGVDLSLVIGSSLAGYLYLLLHVVFQTPISLLWWFWSLGFDGTHIFGTASRTYFDREARHRDRWLLFGSLAFFFSVGPVMVLLGWRAVLAVVFATWAYYHVVRQHFGFVVMYKVKNADLDPVDNRLDGLLLATMLAAPPFHRFFIHSPEQLGMPARWALEKTAAWAEPLLWAAVMGVGGTYLVRLWRQTRAGAPLNLPKLLLLAGVIPLHWLTFAWMSWQAAVPTVTIVHNLQYHALIWFHNRNRYGSGGGVERHGGLPPAVARSLLAYAALAIVFSACYRIPGHHLGNVSELAFGFFCGFGMTHYWLDSKIWRVRRDPALREALQLGPTPPRGL